MWDLLIALIDFAVRLFNICSYLLYFFIDLL
jgi:hypothetical protein